MFDWKRCVAFVLQPATKEGDDEISLLSLHRVDLCCRSHSVVFYLWSLPASALSISLFFLGARACAFFFLLHFLPCYHRALSLLFVVCMRMWLKGDLQCTALLCKMTQIDKLCIKMIWIFFIQVQLKWFCHITEGQGIELFSVRCLIAFALSAKCLIVFYKQWF